MALVDKAGTDTDVRSQMFSVINKIHKPVCSHHTSVAASPSKCQASFSLNFEMLDKTMQISRDIRNLYQHFQRGNIYAV